MILRSAALFSLFASGLCRAETAAGPVTLKEHIRPLLEQYCFDCHNEQKQKGDVNLVPFADNPNLAANRKIWEKIVELTESREMPPEKKAQPTEAQRETLVRFIDGQLSKADCIGPKNPGKVTIRRLNKEEYKNTIGDLMGIYYEPEDFPNDEVGYGFDNIGDVLSLPPMLMEKYLAAAEQIVGQAVVTNFKKAETLRLRGAEFGGSSSKIAAVDDQMLVYREPGAAQRGVEFASGGEFIVRIQARAEKTGGRPAKLTVRMDDKDIQTFDVSSFLPEYEASMSATAGWRKITVAFDDGPPKTPDAPPVAADRTFHLESVQLVAPSGVAAFLPAAHRRLITRLPQPGQEREVAREILARFLPEAYRRPVAATEVERVAKFVELTLANGGTFLEGLQVAFQAVLCSPHFLFRWELDPAGAQPGVVRDLTDYEIASRLSYFLWSTKPDAELNALAAKGELRQPAVLEKQIARMVKDWRIRAFVNNFGGQWLQIRNIWEVDLDTSAFPKWKDHFKGLMKEETERFLEAVIKEDRPVTDLLDADFTFLNEDLARYYGIEGVSGGDFRRVTLPAGSPRGGVLTMGSVLVSTSTPTRTSPVIRGKWILEQILGTPPPAPPADVPPLPEQKQVSQTASLRQRLEQHRANIECAGCHNRMDPLGFALENFDAAGAWRDVDGKFPIDSAGKLSNGTAFAGARDLKQVLKANKNFTHSLAEKMLTYALGRGLEHFDKCAVDAIVADLPKRGNRFSALVIGIVTSDPFLKRRPEVAQN